MVISNDATDLILGTIPFHCTWYAYSTYDSGRPGLSREWLYIFMVLFCPERKLRVVIIDWSAVDKYQQFNNIIRPKTFLRVQIFTSIGKKFAKCFHLDTRWYRIRVSIAYRYYNHAFFFHRASLRFTDMVSS